jgi:agmatine/peptidylarginine deiminase
MTSKRFFPAEWHTQDMVQLTWPDASTDWCHMLEQVLPCYSNLVREISKRQKLLIVARDQNEVLPWIDNAYAINVTVVEMPVNDTWARDHGFITVFENNHPVMLDFKFNGWGLKFAADKDNVINSKLFKSNIFASNVVYENHLNMVLEGGSVESDGNGTVLTTSECLLSPNRNGQWSRQDIECQLKTIFGAQQVLWLDNGYLSGDDTDSHIDTLARLAPGNRIIYVKCDNPGDEHYDALKKMERQLESFINADGEPFSLIPLPMASPVYDDGERLPATYANFLFINGAILVPVYGLPEDDAAIDVFKTQFPDQDIVAIDCSPLIRQHGSLHCVTMQFPKYVLNQKSWKEFSK